MRDYNDGRAVGAAWMASQTLDQLHGELQDAFEALGLRHAGRAVLESIATATRDIDTLIEGWEKTTED